MSSLAEAPDFVAPVVQHGDIVLFNNGSDLDTWFPAFVSRYGMGSGGPALEVLIAAHDGGGVGDSDRAAANCTLIARDNVKHIDDPYASSEQYQIHVIGDGQGGYWKLTPGDEANRAKLRSLEQQISELRKSLNKDIASRASKPNPT